jgi:uncharacterized RDD family membrane protein YckC
MLDHCTYCYQPLGDTPTTWCPSCKSRLKPLSLMPGMQIFARFGARLLDVFFLGAVMAVAAGPLLWLDPGNVLLQLYIKLWLFLGYLVLLPVTEAWMLSTWGTTPGKWLLRLHLIGPESAMPSFQQALKRVCLLYHHMGYFMSSLGLAFALILMVTQQVFYAQLLLLAICVLLVVLHAKAYITYRKSNGHTEWDSQLGLRVQHRVLRFERLMMAVLTYFLLQAATEYLSHWPDITPHPSILM